MLGTFSLACSEAERAELPPLPELEGAAPEVIAHLGERRAALANGSSLAARRYGMALQVHGFESDAAKIYREYRDHAPDSFAFDYLCGLALKSSDIEGARKAFEAARESRPSYRPLLLESAWMALGEGRPGLAKRDLERALELKRDAIALAARAEVALAERKWQEARKYSRAALKLAPRRRAGWESLTRAESGLGRESSARRYRQVAESLPAGRSHPDPVAFAIYDEAKSFGLIVRHARALASAGAIEEAKARFEEARQLRPDSAEVAIALGRLALRGGNGTQARHFAEGAVSNDSASFDAKFLAAEAALQSGAKAKSLAEFEELFATHSERWELRLMLGNLLQNLRPREAKAHLRFVIEKTPLVAEAPLILAKILANEERRDRAREVLDAYLALDSSHVGLQAARAELN